MSVPVWVLLAFAAWTLLALFGSVGWYRWSRILTGRAQINEFTPDVPHGSDWYRRAMRAHANCIENLPIYAAIVIAIIATGMRGRGLDALAIILLVARICQTVTHIVFQPTNTVVAVRFAFFLTQVLCMFSMGIIVALYA